METAKQDFVVCARKKKVRYTLQQHRPPLERRESSLNGANRPPGRVLVGRPGGRGLAQQRIADLEWHALAPSSRKTHRPFAAYRSFCFRIPVWSRDHNRHLVVKKYGKYPWKPYKATYALGGLFDITFPSGPHFPPSCDSGEYAPLPSALCSM